MTAKKINRLAGNIFFAMLGVSILFMLDSCSKKTMVSDNKPVVVAPPDNSPIVIPPENAGRVQIKRDENSNYMIQINLKDLEGTSELESSGKKYYVVWMNTLSKRVENLGQINSNSGWFADRSKASFERVSKYRPTKIFITAEETASSKKPSSRIVWTTNRF